MKTVNELNEKVWYRLLRVVYIIFFLGIFIFSNWANITFNFNKVDQENSVINCTFNNKKILAKDVKDLKIRLDDKYVFKYEIKEILISCYGSDQLDKYRPKESEILEKFRAWMKENGSDDSLSAISDFERSSFNIEYVYSYNDLVMYFLAINLAIILVFEGIKRVFYYVVLGKIRPDKGK